MAHMPKTPRRSLRSYLRMAPMVVVPLRDTEILADLECHRPPPNVLPSATIYKLGKPAPEPPKVSRITLVVEKTVDLLMLAAATAIVGAVLVSVALAGLVMIFPQLAS